MTEVQVQYLLRRLPGQAAQTAAPRQKLPAALMWQMAAGKPYVVED